MTDLQKSAATIESALSECGSHIEKLERGHKLLGDFFPLSDNSLKKCSPEQIEHIDQFIYRFTKLQDSMGTRLLPSLHAVMEGNSSPIPFLDVLARLAKLGVVTSEEDWQFFRNLRNNLTHDYPESVAQTALTLNTLFQEFHRLENLHRQAATHAGKVLEKIKS